MSMNTSRIHVIDALRGFAIVSILLLHNIEHFDLIHFPDNLPVWMVAIDKNIWDSLFFLFGGKSYAIFALLFGITFFIQSEGQERKGKDFRLRFAWRLILLFGFGIINSAFYEGDILTIYALIGFFLLPVAKLSNKVVFWIAIILMLQPYEWVKFISVINNPAQEFHDPASWAYFGKSSEYLTANSLLNTLIGNLTNGKQAVILWSWEKGRIFQTLALFMLGMLAGRKYLFIITNETKLFWKRLLLSSVVLFIPLYIVKNKLGVWIENEAIRRPIETIEASWSNLAFMFILVSGFVLLYQIKFFQNKLNFFSPIGRMSLSSYVIQSIIGSIIYYGYGFGLYKFTGASYCLFIGVILAIFQWYFSTWWIQKFRQGPLEIIWHKLTWLGAK